MFNIFKCKHRGELLDATNRYMDKPSFYMDKIISQLL